MVEHYANFLERLKGMDVIPLDEQLRIEEQEEATQRALKAIWTGASYLSSINKKTEVTLRIPSQRLIELGIVSYQTSSKIAETEAMRGEPDVNVIMIQRDPDGNIFIKESYREVKVAFEKVNGHPLPKNIYVDTFVEEDLTLYKEGDQRFYGKAIKKTLPSHIHMGENKFVADSKVELPFSPMEITPRAINTTIALLIEGLVNSGGATKFFAKPKSS